jgi:malonyl-CoA reductase / 3-hydroxypropionate dehydrogenase (NADP+)
VTGSSGTETSADRRRAPRGRLAGKVAVITGAGGNIGQELCRRYLQEGATIAMVGRSEASLEAVRDTLRRALRVGASRILVVPADASDPGQVRSAIARIIARLGRIDVLINNAGSAGPKRVLQDLPMTVEELAATDRFPAERESCSDAARNLLGVAWQMVRAAAPHLAPGASIINVSTIFSRTQYFGRTAYVVPKAAMNALSRHLATELGPRGIRVNTVFPGPIASERIRNVFGAMDRLRGAADGATAEEFFGLMSLARAQDGAPPVRTFPTIEDVANTIVFLGADESAAFNGHHFEVTHGMYVRQESRSTWVSRPELRTVDGTGVRVLIAAGDQVADAITTARVQAHCGADVLLGLGSEESVRAAQDALGVDPVDVRIVPRLFDRTRVASVDALFAEIAAGTHPLQGAIVLPASGAWRFRGGLATASDGDVTAFLDSELVGAMVVARALSRHWQAHPPSAAPPRVVFLSNADDGAGNVYGDILRAALEELCRVWRDESVTMAARPDAGPVIWSNQVVRWSNAEQESTPFAAGQAARLLYTQRRIRQVNLYLPESIVEATGSHRATFGWMENLMGLHLGKVALITGGSAGIGGQVARLLAIAGARVMLVARRTEQLDEMRTSIVRELEDIGYFGAGQRVQCLGGVDVADESTLGRAVDETVARFGRLDYLINNAGVAGAEQMVVDMGIDQWRTTLAANLVSNYSLMDKVVPIMKAQGSGYILNVSSYFGGEKYIAVPYPNRADYAVSKAGQRAMVENFARFVGPEIQLTAIAPGPVDGDRLRGTGGKPGLFERRARLIAENRRLNLLYAAVCEAMRAGVSAAACLDVLANNDAATLSVRADVPAAIRAFAVRVGKEATAHDSDASSDRFLMNPSVAMRLVSRLRLGGRFLGEIDQGARFDTAWLDAIPVPPEPFHDRALLRREAGKIREGVLGMLHLRNMPSETEVALATVYFLADRAVSGETFQPSGGLHQERTITERELFGRAKPERLARMAGRSMWLIGDYMTAQLARAIRLALESTDLKSIVLLVRNEGAAQEVLAMLRIVRGVERVKVMVVGDDLEATLDRALVSFGTPTAVVSTPFSPVPDAMVGESGHGLDAAAFAHFVEEQLTHHFRVARKVSLLDDVRLVLVTPDVPLHPTHASFALANFVKTTLHALTATLGVENERLVHNVPVNQVNLTRRVRSEEPRDIAEQAEEQERFAHAVLLSAAPLPDADASRYRARIYRGLAITV